MSARGIVNHTILILIDDVRAKHLFDLIQKKKLPNLAKLSREGISCRNCITSFPSITFPCYSNIILGAYSGYYPKNGSGIPMYHWIGRTDPPTEGNRFPIINNYSSARYIRKIYKHIGTNAKTIFEQAGEGNFLSALNLINRGSLFMPPEEYTTVSILKTVENAFQNPRDFQFDEPPKVTVAYVPKTDDLMHHQGFDHPEYTKELIKADNSIGSLMKTLRETGYYDSTAIGIISDHGNFKAKKMHDLEPFFQEVGLQQYNPKKGTGDFDANIGSVGFFNFPGKDWHLHPTVEEMEKFQISGNGKNINLFETLWKIPGVKYMYYRDNGNTPDKGTIHIRYRDEKVSLYEGRIEYEGHGIEQRTKFSYDNLELYGYEFDERSAKLLDGKYHDIDTWLEGTNHIDFPMIIDQIPRYFKNPRSCDIIISTLGEYGFGYEHGETKADYPYSHDICLKKSMTVPFIIGGSPELPIKELKYCKTTDMVPTLISLLGETPDKSVVGRSVI
jgi:hypothetical protein